MKIKDSCILITGAASGIGRSLAYATARRGGRLALVDCDADALEATTAAIAQAVPSAPPPVAVCADVEQPADVAHMVQAATERLGGLDILVNNAGRCVYGSTERTSVPDFEWLLRVNFLGPLRGMFAVLPAMKKQGGGLIVNIASLAVFHGVPYLGAYSASKAALTALSQSLRAELAGTGVRILLVHPNDTETNLFKTEKKVGGARRPDGPFDDPDRVAGAIARAIEADKRDLILTLEGKALAVVEAVVPGVTEAAMRHFARTLRDETEVCHA